MYHPGHLLRKEEEEDEDGFTVIGETTSERSMSGIYSGGAGAPPDYQTAVNDPPSYHSLPVRAL